MHANEQENGDAVQWKEQSLVINGWRSACWWGEWVEQSMREVGGVDFGSCRLVWYKWFTVQFMAD